MTGFNSETIPGVVLAAGRSSRMGQDKATILLRGITLLDHVIGRLRPQVSHIAINSDVAPALPHVPDIIAGKLGPLAGIHAAMTHGQSVAGVTHVATVPVDTPFFPSDLVSWLSGAIKGETGMAVAASESGPHPVFGLWPVGLADDLSHWMQADDKRRVRDFLKRHDAAVVRFPLQPTRATLLDPFFNINTPDDLAEAERWIAMLT
ncbi:molybdenum cofactor guanylyltransferase MobA [Oryzifoliimicrobium ureilyticus]|uniref:molybdenum cofactor guanylyltransferase MobA n=1 Tax=Oryzifoliimicrobium ureilyticus TaxID=3113724 RepID=UPI0030765DFD